MVMVMVLILSEMGFYNLDITQLSLAVREVHSLISKDNELKLICSASQLLDSFSALSARQEHVT